MTKLDLTQSYLGEGEILTVVSSVWSDCQWEKSHHPEESPERETIDGASQPCNSACHLGAATKTFVFEPNLHETEGAVDLCHKILEVLLPQNGVFR